MKAITLWPEWAWAILHLGKDIENRGYPLPESLIGKWIGLHAGKHVGGKPGFVATVAGWEGVANMAGDCWECQHSAPGPGWTGTPTAFVWDPIAKDAPRPTSTRIELATTPLVTSAIVAVVRFGRPRPPIAFGGGYWRVASQWGWPISDMMPLATPVPCKGAQGLWEVPANILDKCREVGTVKP